jgi:hypothetical protein
MDDVSKKNELIQKYLDTVRAKEELMEKFQTGQLTLEEAGLFVTLNEEQYQLVTEMIGVQLIQIHLDEQ